jgi:hypothetical protein
VIPTPSEGERGPNKLQKRFELARRKRDNPPGGKSSTFSFPGVKARFSENRWHLNGRIAPNVDEHHGWEADFSLSLVDEDGTNLDDVPIERFSPDSSGCHFEIEDGEVHLKVYPDVHSVKFQGMTGKFSPGSRFDPDTSGEVEIRIKGRAHTAD